MKKEAKLSAREMPGVAEGKGEEDSRGYIGSYLRNLKVKEFSKSVYICRSQRSKVRLLLFTYTVRSCPVLHCF